MIRLILLQIVIIQLTACKKEPKQHAVINPSVDSLIHFIQDSLEQYRLNQQDRTIWQKPYEIIEMLGPLEDKVIADIGAGSGYFSFKFIHKAKKVIAIDIEKELIDLMNDEKKYYKQELQNRFEARLTKPNDPGLEDQEADIIFMSNTYCYIENRIPYLQMLRHKLKEGGRIMIVDFKKKITPIGPTLDSRLGQGDVENELIKAGFNIIISDDTSLQYQYIVIARN